MDLIFSILQWWQVNLISFIKLTDASLLYRSLRELVNLGPGGRRGIAIENNMYSNHIRYISK